MLIISPVATQQDLATYLDELSGGDIGLHPVESPARGLPAHLGRHFELQEGLVFGRQMLFALDRGKQRGLTPTRILADYEALLRALPGAFVVLVLNEMPPYLRRRLIAAGVPFVMPGWQVFLPELLVHLRERQRGQAPAAPTHLGWAAQVVLLRHLLAGDIEPQNLAGVAATCGYTPMAISNAQQQLVGAKLAKLRKVGRSKHLTFQVQGRALWELALPLLRRPWRKLHAVTFEGKPPRTWIAGADALAEGTTLAASRVPHVAMAATALREQLGSGVLTTCPAADEANAMVEAWEYDPSRLATGGVVDALSLFLCLRDDPEERVQIALEQHMDAFRWSAV